MYALVTHLLPLVDPVPQDDEVKAGWVAFWIFLGLIVAVALIGWFLSRSLKKSKATLEAGGYDERTPRSTGQ
ncbi:MAG: hypothetical protein EOO74_08705 [Myxococcales bacterium]|nr:MAG: hypothetical protein EOO74_08705 [Myxococcales bacterium]